MTALLDVRGLRTEFLTRQGPVVAVDDLSLQVAPGEILGLVGDSGSGKSVTGFSLLGLLEPPGRVVAGEIRFAGEDLRRATPARLRALRGDRLAMIFQDPMTTLNPLLRLGTQMTETLRAHRRIGQRAAWQQACAALERLGIAQPDLRLRGYPHELSGGMRQRVAIAIALLNRPALVIADEPTTALDVTIQAQILGEVQALAREQGTALIWITHDLGVVAGLADRVAVMYAGRLVEQGPVDALLDHPAHPYTAGLLASLPSRAPRGSRLSAIPGSTPDLARLPAGCAFATRCDRAQADCLQGTPAIRHLDAEREYRCLHPLETC